MGLLKKVGLSSTLFPIKILVPKPSSSDMMQPSIKITKAERYWYLLTGSQSWRLCVRYGKDEQGVPVPSSNSSVEN